MRSIFSPSLLIAFGFGTGLSRRAPGTVGEERTVGYLIGRFQALGLEPGGTDGQWVRSACLGPVFV